MAFTVAIREAGAGGHVGAKQHLLEAASQISSGNFGASVRESIHAVEAVTRQLTGKKDFAEALRALDKKKALHPAFRGALEKLFGYASDAEGIRHSLLEKVAADVTESEALFCLTVCSAYVPYIIEHAASKG